ncbi:MAG: tetratricopeptide repeat protein, partial [Candidatus Latescibacteria bacterium]|nr:tetratricopeptide repeat protein [Candidatus Latescibacterota bacterium]
TPSRTTRAVLAVGALVYAAAVAAASAHQGPRGWGLHLPGFLSPPARLLVLALIVGGAALLAADLVRRTPRRESPVRLRGAPSRRGRNAPSFPRWSAWLLLIPWAWILWSLRTRTHFLGDGTVWLEGLRYGSLNPFSEPLSAAVWSGFAAILGTMNTPIEAANAGAFSVLCGLLAAPVLWGVVTEIARGAGGRALALGALGTLGATQLYFGYIESYPPTSVAIYLYLWLGLRRARGAGNPFLLAGSAAAALTSHLSGLYLLPSYFLLIARERAPILRRAALLALPLAVAAGTLLLLGYRPERWLGSFQIAARAALPGQGAASLAKPYAALSLDHAWDLANAILLILPVPALLLAACVPSLLRRGLPRRAGAGTGSLGSWRPDAQTLFLAVAAASGLLMAIVLVLPIPPAQDWDLTSLLLLPAAVLGVRVGLLRGLAERTRGIALTSIGAGALLSFVLVNANEPAGIARFETIIRPGAKITAYGRAYGNELLASYDEDRGDHASALVHARRALDAEPTNPRYWIKAGAALYELRRYDEAIPLLEEGIRRGPKRHDGYYDLGNCLTRKGRYAEAAYRFREAIALSEPRPDYLHNLGVALYHGGNADSARAVWGDVLRRWPGYALSVRSMMRYFGPASGETVPGAAPGPAPAQAGESDATVTEPPR